MLNAVINCAFAQNNSALILSASRRPLAARQRAGRRVGQKFYTESFRRWRDTGCTTSARLAARRLFGFAPGGFPTHGNTARRRNPLSGCRTHYPSHRDRHPRVPRRPSGLSRPAVFIQKGSSAYLRERFCSAAAISTASPSISQRTDSQSDEPRRRQKNSQYSFVTRFYDPITYGRTYLHQNLSTQNYSVLPSASKISFAWKTRLRAYPVISCKTPASTNFSTYRFAAM